MEHGLGAFGRANLHPGRNPLDRQGGLAPQPLPTGRPPSAARIPPALPPTPAQCRVHPTSGQRALHKVGPQKSPPCSSLPPNRIGNLWREPAERSGDGCAVPIVEAITALVLDGKLPGLFLSQVRDGSEPLASVSLPLG